MWALKERTVAVGAGLLALFLLYYTLTTWLEYGTAVNVELLQLAQRRDACKSNYAAQCEGKSSDYLMYIKMGAQCEEWFWCHHEVSDRRLEATAHDNIANGNYRGFSRQGLLFVGLAAVAVACLVGAFFQAWAWDAEKAAKREKHNLPQKKKNY